MRYVGHLYGLYPSNEGVAWKVDSTLDAIEDITNAFVRAKWEADAEKKATLTADLMSKTFPTWLGIIDKRIANNSNHSFVAGDSLTIADLALVALFNSTAYNDANEHHGALRSLVE